MATNEWVYDINLKTGEITANPIGYVFTGDFVYLLSKNVTINGQAYYQLTFANRNTRNSAGKWALMIGYIKGATSKVSTNITGAKNYFGIDYVFNPAAVKTSEEITYSKWYVMSDWKWIKDNNITWSRPVRVNTESNAH